MHNGSMFDWNDLRHFLAVARSGSTIAAARELGVNQSTVHRRLAELERAIGGELFARTPTGYRLNDFGQSMIAQARDVEHAITMFANAARAADVRNAELIRLTCPEPIIGRITHSGLLDRFHAKYPHLKIEFVMSDRYLDLKKGDADVALRSGDNADSDLVGRKIADSLWALYASARYIDEHGRPERFEDLRGRAFVGFDESMSGHRSSQWLASVPEARIVARNNSVLGLIYAAKSGIGLAPLPTAIGDSEPDLIRVMGPVPEMSRSWRILATRQMRRTPKINALFDFITSEKPALKSMLTG
jgi:DNA-binding transcriptional LysR family regulator